MASVNVWLPVQTPFGFAHMPESNIAPLPTAQPFPNSLESRQVIDTTSLTSVCGYISGIKSNSVTCPKGSYCGFQEALGAIGCCASYHTTLSTQVVLESCNYHLACLGADDISEGNCDDTCMSNDLILKCTESSASFCATYSFSGWGINSYVCGDFYEYDVQTTFTTAGQTTTPPEWVTTTYTGLPFEDSGAEPTTMMVAAPQIHQSESELGPNVEKITASVVGAIFGSVVLFAAALLFCLRRRVKPPKTIRFAIAPDDISRQPLVMGTPDSFEMPYIHNTLHP
ncbi:hypothetical protein F5Y16DRAFT_390451 [Xylariaceae sp. FL0255]|nr:hypothetical protein F5Y16DRAFT_390451 [Xylariaceae sp. FL0255]